MPMATLRIADEFNEDLALIYSGTLLNRIHTVLNQLLNQLLQFPDMGSPNVRPSLIQQYGEGIRTLSLSSFVLVYRHRDEVVDVPALIHGPRIQ